MTKETNSLWDFCEYLEMTETIQGSLFFRNNSVERFTFHVAPFHCILYITNIGVQSHCQQVD